MSDAEASGAEPIAHCTLALGCFETTYQLECTLTEDASGYECSCSTNGVETKHYTEEDGCAWQTDASLGDPESVFATRCEE